LIRYTNGSSSTVYVGEVTLRHKGEWPVYSPWDRCEDQLVYLYLMWSVPGSSSTVTSEFWTSKTTIN